MSNDTTQTWLRRAATARPGARRIRLVTDRDIVTRYVPRLAGRNVHLSGGPMWYDTRAEAVEAARRARDLIAAEAQMSNETTHTPADVRERVEEAWATVEAAALAQANVLDSHYGGQPAQAAEIRNAVEQVAALLRTPRGEGEAEALAALVVRIWTRCKNEGPNYRETDEFWLDFERAYQLAALRSDAQGEDRWEDLVFGPITQAYNEAHAALRDGAQGDAEALAAADMERVPTTKGEI